MRKNNKFIFRFYIVLWMFGIMLGLFGSAYIQNDFFMISCIIIGILFFNIGFIKAVKTDM